jgi:GNAT superfamily N-acetyltransferase
MKGPTRSIGVGVVTGMVTGRRAGPTPDAMRSTELLRRGELPRMEILTYPREYLDPIIRMCEGISFATSLSDPDRADRVSRSWLSRKMSSSASPTRSPTASLQAYLSMLPVSPAHQRRGIASALIEATMERSDAIRLDLASSEEAEPLYRTFSSRRLPGYRLYVGGEPGEVE